MSKTPSTAIRIIAKGNTRNHKRRVRTLIRGWDTQKVCQVDKVILTEIIIV